MISYPKSISFESHQLSSFVAGIEHAGTSRVGYSIYDNGELVVANTASLNIDIESAIITAVWSVTHYVIKNNLSMYDLDIYINDKPISNALTEFWYMLMDYSRSYDAPKIDNVLNDCCNIKSVAFNYLDGTEEGIAEPYAERMVRLKASLIDLPSPSHQ